MVQIPLLQELVYLLLLMVEVLVMAALEVQVAAAEIMVEQEDQVHQVKEMLVVQETITVISLVLAVAAE
jgi:hypothetical protein